MQYVIYKVKLNEETGRYIWKNIGVIKDRETAKSITSAYNALNHDYHLQALPVSGKIIS